MNALIIEDELPARAKLKAMLLAVDSSVRIVGLCGSVKETLAWLDENEPPDVAFVDIQLSDDHSFEIFRRRTVHFPVIFTTAYDKYLLESFEFNSIDYLLKPINEDKLKRSLDKLKRVGQHFQKKLLELVQPVATQKKQERIIARKGTEFVAITHDEIAYLYTDHKMVFLRDTRGRQLIVDKNIGAWEEILDPLFFFRLNRKYLAHIHSIERFKTDNSKIRIFLKPETKEEVHVSKETAPRFRQWIGNR